MDPVGRPGDDLLSRVLGRSTMGAGGFHGRVRDGIGCFSLRKGHQVIEGQASEFRGRKPVIGDRRQFLPTTDFRLPNPGKRSGGGDVGSSRSSD